MTEQEILEKLTRILRDLLADESVVLTMDTTRTDVPNWDSFIYVTFIAAAEMQLGIRFRVADVESFATVGDVVRQALKLLNK
ncbi:MAG TPA: acyl carrier protein [Steroidobacteraceae bacterium]